MAKRLWRQNNGKFQFVNISCATCNLYTLGSCKALWFDFELSKEVKDCIIPFVLYFDTIKEYDDWNFKLLNGTKHTRMTYKCITKIGDPCYIERAFLKSDFFGIEIPLIDVIISEVNNLWKASNYGQ